MSLKPMRRKDRAIDKKEAEGVLAQGEYGVLASVSAEGQPYAVPLSYIFLNGNIYFHSAKVGHKIDNFDYESRVSFAVVGETKPIYDKDFTTYFESVIFFGEISLLEDEEEKFTALHELAKKYLPDHMDKADADIKKSFSRTAVYVLKGIFSGKAKRPR